MVFQSPWRIGNKELLCNLSKSQKASVCDAIKKHNLELGLGTQSKCYPYYYLRQDIVRRSYIVLLLKFKKLILTLTFILIHSSII